MPRPNPRGRVQIAPAVCFGAALALLVLPLRWCLAAVAAAAIHELCHYGAVRLCGGTVRFSSLNLRGAVMESSPMPAWKNLLCSLAGPLGSLAAAFFLRRFPRVAVCAAVQALYNLLPLLPLDGGRALGSLALLLLPEQAARSCAQWADRLCRGVVALLGLYGTAVARLGALPVLLAALILLQTGTKSACKIRASTVQ